MAANKDKRDGTRLLSGLSNIDPAMQKPAEEKQEALAPTPTVIPAAPKKAPAKKKRAPGRPKKYDENEVLEVLGVRIPDYQMRFLEANGWAYGGKTGYVRHIIAEEMKRLGK